MAGVGHRSAFGGCLFLLKRNALKNIFYPNHPFYTTRCIYIKRYLI